VIDAEPSVHARVDVRSHAGRPPEEVIAAIVETCIEVLAQAGLEPEDVIGVGVGFAGHTNGATGRVLASSNLPDWDDYPLRDVLHERLRMPVVLENDANCAAWAEYLFGAGRGSRRMCYVTFSTGTGSGIVLDGKLYAGATGTAGEIGHTIVDPGGPLCGCGKRGCVMSYASGIGISRMVRERLAGGEDTVLRETCGPSPERVPGEVVAAAAQNGDRVAIEVLQTAGSYLGIGLSTIMELLNPDRIVIGGGLTHIGPLVMDPCIRTLDENIQPSLVGSAELVPSQLGDDAGLIGAGALVWERAPRA
jgi:glucokinase